MASNIRQNYSSEAETAVNGAVNQCQSVSYTYLSLAAFFDRDDVALKGMEEFCQSASRRHQESATKLMKYQTERGGRLKLADVPVQNGPDWGNSAQALQVALKLEKSQEEAFRGLHDVGDSVGDPHLEEFVEEDLLQGQVAAIKSLGDKISALRLAGNKDLGEFLFDQEILGS